MKLQQNRFSALKSKNHCTVALMSDVKNYYNNIWSENNDRILFLPQ